MHDEEMASSPAEFWRRREELVPATEVAEAVDGYRLVLLVDVADPEVLAWYDHVAEALSRFACFDTLSPDTLHLTVKLFDVAVPLAAADRTEQPAALTRVSDVAADAVATADPFEAEITQFNLFPDVVYGEVADDGQLAALNRAVCSHTQVTALDRDGAGFIPHLTFGYFTGDEDYDAIVEFIGNNRELRSPTVPIDEVHLTAYEVGSRPPTYSRIDTYRL
jgi:2'-5' RNA ligase